MRTVSDLRRTLDDHTLAAPLGLDVVAAARARGLRLRRRRRVLAGTAAAVLALAAFVPWHRDRAEPIVVAAPPYRTAADLSFSLVPGSPFVMIEQVGAAGRQSAAIRSRVDLEAERPEHTNANPGAELVVHDPGTFDASAARAGTPVTVNGRAAFLTGGPLTVSWEDASGAWLVVTSAGGRQTPDELVEVASAVQVGAPAPARMPARFGWMPDGWEITEVMVGPRDTAIRYGEKLDVRMTPGRNPNWPEARTETPAPGVRMWHLEQPNKQFSGSRGSNTAIAASDCLLYLSVSDRSRVTLGDLRRIAAAVEVTSCADPRTWRPIR